MNLGRLALRLVVGGLFVGHGAQKLLGMFGGHGLDGTAGFFEAIGLRPGRLHATVAGCAEFGGGLLLVLGLLTPFAAAAITATMVAAIITVHYAKGLWNTDGGYELNLLILAAVFALTGVGAGKWSLDHALNVGDNGAGWAVGALVVGLLGGAGAVASGRRGQRRPRSDQAPAARASDTVPPGPAVPAGR